MKEKIEGAYILALKDEVFRTGGDKCSMTDSALLPNPQI